MEIDIKPGTKTPSRKNEGRGIFKNRNNIAKYRRMIRKLEKY